MTKLPTYSPIVDIKERLERIEVRLDRIEKLLVNNSSDNPLNYPVDLGGC